MDFPTFDDEWAAAAEDLPDLLNLTPPDED
jgi:hypothetical protein